MRKFNLKFKSAFTLMEIGMSLLVVSILVMLCIPLINNQIKKTDEYAYYLAFKTVERMGAQIVAYGDPAGVSDDDEGGNEEGAFNINNPFNFKHYLAAFSDKLFKTLNPKAYAMSETSEILSFPSYEYDYVRVCLGNENVVKDYDVYAGNLWTYPEIISLGQQALCENVYKINPDFVAQRFMCKNSTITKAQLIETLKTTSMDASAFCKWIAARCTGAYDCVSSGNKSCYRNVLLTQTSNIASYGECMITVSDPDIDYSSPHVSVTSDTTVSNAVNCTRYGYSGVYNAGENDALSCNCDSSHPVKALNNKSICCAQSGEGLFPYYITPNFSEGIVGGCINCQYGAFNEKTGTCCPANSKYSPALGRCICDDGYTPQADNPTLCNISGSDCPAGSHKSGNICISNSPIVSAKRFCELVVYTWNVSTYNCSNFTKSDNIEYNADLYSAITKDSTPYLSAKAVQGAFNDLEPNITFANGLRMWILSDRSASISGLSFDPSSYVPALNTCVDKGLMAEDECTNAEGEESCYYCKNDSHCFNLNAGDGELKLKDARNCCSTADFSDLIPLYEGYDYLKDPRTYAISGFTVFIDINGTKDNDDLGGGGTLWKDVFPFYISSNGHVYPGYPLNASKAGSVVKGGDDEENTTRAYDSSSLFQGGNSTALSADVYYYEVKNGKRKKYNAYSSIPYARALCFSTEISAFTPYCQNLGSKFRHSMSPIDQFIYSDANKCWKHRCFVKLKNKVKFL